MSAIGLIGLGSWGRRCADTLSRLPEASLAAVHDISARTLEGFRVGADVQKTADIDEFLAASALTSVVIAAPTPCHLGLALRALEAGLDVLVEKPMTETGSQALELVEAAESLGKVLAVGHIMLYHPSFRELRKAVDSGAHGPVDHIESVRTSSGLPDSDVLGDLACHDIAMAIALKGRPVAARASEAGDDRHAASFELMFTDETLLCGHVAWTDAQPVRRFDLRCSRGTVSLDQGTPEGTGFRDTPLARQCLDFLRCCATRRTPVSAASLGVEVMLSLDALRESIESGSRWVTTEQPAAVS